MSESEQREAPQRVRLEKLQEVHVPELVKLDHACSALYWELGFDAAEVPTRTHGDFYRLPKSNAVWVAEADGTVAGFIAYHDEEPGVGFVEDVSVHPEFQRWGIGRRLMDRAVSELAHLGFTEVVLKVFEQASWATAFYGALGFLEYRTEEAPQKLREWRESKLDTEDRPLLRPGQKLLWRKLT